MSRVLSPGMPMFELSEKLRHASHHEQDQFARLALIMLNLPVRHFVIPLPDGKTPYLERFILDEGDQQGNGKVYLHLIYESDGDRDPHDHPFDFTSTIIWGAYRESGFLRSCTRCELDFTDDITICPRCERFLAARKGKVEAFQAGDQNVKKAHDLHKLEIIKGPVVTLVRRGPKVREWGFLTDCGWEGHKSYIARKFPGAQPTEVD